MNWRNQHNFCNDVLDILEITCHFLQQYFGHTPEIADKLVSDYFDAFGKFATEDYIAHEMSWNLAIQVHYTIALQGKRTNVAEWQIENDLHHTPREALAYMREHYWKDRLSL